MDTINVSRKLIDTLELTNHLFIKRLRHTTHQGLFSVFVLQFFWKHPLIKRLYLKKISMCSDRHRQNKWWSKFKFLLYLIRSVKTKAPNSEKYQMKVELQLAKMKCEHWQHHNRLMSRWLDYINAMCTHWSNGYTVWVLLNLNVSNSARCEKTCAITAIWSCFR